MKNLSYYTIFLLLLISYSNCLIVKIAPYMEECVVERVDANTILSGSYEVGNGGNMRISVKVFFFFIYKNR